MADEEKELATPGPWETSSKPHDKSRKGGHVGRPEEWRYVRHNFPEAPYEGEFSDEWGIYPPLGEAGPVALVSGEANAKLIVQAPSQAEKIRVLELQLRHAQNVIMAAFEVSQIDPHEENPKCPEDDTCECKWAAEINEALQGYKSDQQEVVDAIVNHLLGAVNDKPKEEKPAYGEPGYQRDQHDTPWCSKWRSDGVICCMALGHNGNHMNGGNSWPNDICAAPTDKREGH